MRRDAPTRPASPAEARAYLAKAREFLRAATDSLELANHIAATGQRGPRRHRGGRRDTAALAHAVWKGEHSQAAAYLESAGGAQGKLAARQLRRLLPLKNQAEYDPVPR